MHSTQVFGVYSGDRRAILRRLFPEMQMLPFDASHYAACKQDPANFGIAPGMRAMKARLAQRGPRTRADRERQLIRIKQAFQHATAEHHADWPTCVHEAGHAVACVITRIPLQSVGRFSPADDNCDPNTLGFVRSKNNQANPRAVGIAAYTGPLAASKVTGQPERVIGPDTAAIDHAVRRQLRGSYTFAEDGRLRDAWRSAAKVLVASAWPAIEAVARELRVKAYLRGTDVRAIVARHVTLD